MTDRERHHGMDETRHPDGDAFDAALERALDPVEVAVHAHLPDRRARPGDDDSHDACDENACATTRR